MKVAKGIRPQAKDFYVAVLQELHEGKLNFMLGGGFALYHYTGIERDTKDLDIFCKPSEYPKILKHLHDKGFQTEQTDVRWLAKIYQDDHYIDVIFDTVNNICTVDDSWYDHASEGTYEGIPIKYLPAEELMWCKIYVQNRERYDGADVNHLLLKYGHKLDWKRLLFRMDPHWHLLLAQLLSFQFVYPADYHDIIPRWLFDELIERAKSQYDLPPAVEKVCRGPVIDQTQYETDIKLWNYKVSTIKTT
ncbi:nucleotidyltransferase [Chitinophaga horti]|uniref:Nucleotidyltransferase n=1 Tax=Chitinophaga horti TaxID=2920382 RepID=A0ABY6JBR4_9BACT|nr:nucleotidyltransferase [Chitinophaga horti]UYQ95634.1 nucleotidyltransferase [Chitinophaga horti]